jgi:hypothetical protein
MPECLVNNVPTPLDSGLQTWGDLLDGLDRQLGAARQVVTAARFDGVDQPTFREASLAEIRLESVGRIEVDVADGSALVLSTLDLARDSLPVLADSARQVGRAFRRGDFDTALHQLPPVLDAVRTLMKLTDAAATAAGTSLETVRKRLPADIDACAAVLCAIASLATHQDAEDWVATADVLEHELAPALIEWRVLIDVIAESCLV